MFVRTPEVFQDLFRVYLRPVGTHKPPVFADPDGYDVCVDAGVIQQALLYGNAALFFVHMGRLFS